MALAAAERVSAAAVVAICPATSDGLLRGLRQGRFDVPRRPPGARRGVLAAADLEVAARRASATGCCSCTPRATRPSRSSSRGSCTRPRRRAGSSSCRAATTARSSTTRSCRPWPCGSWRRSWPPDLASRGCVAPRSSPSSPRCSRRRSSPRRHREPTTVCWPASDGPTSRRPPAIRSAASPRRPARRRACTPGCSRARSSCSAAIARSRSSRSTSSWSPGGLVKEAAERNADIGLDERTSSSARRTRTPGRPASRTSDLQHARAEPGDDDRPETFVELLQRPRRPDRAALHLPGRAARARDQQAARDLAPAGGGLGARRADRRHAQPQRSRPTWPTTGSSPSAAKAGRARTPRARPHDRPRRRRAAGRPLGCEGGAAEARAVRVPIGGWSNFANHGTVIQADYQALQPGPPRGRRTGSSRRAFARRARSRRAAVVNVYGNGNEGDQSAGPEGQGPERRRAGRAHGGRAMFAPGGRPGAR